jgi:hypothetical protein
MPSTQLDGDGDGDPPCVGADVPLWPVDGVLVGAPDPPPLDPPPPVGLAGELVRGWADGLVDGFLPPVVARGLVAPVVAALLGRTPPLAGADLLDGPDEGTWLVAAPLVAELRGDVWFAAGAPLNAPDASTATSPALTARAETAPMARPLPRFRGLPGGRSW